MRPPTLQYFYLQKPLTLIIVIATISVLFWIGMGDFYTKGEPREALVAVSMINDGNWILPHVYADEFAYKPPLTHWLIAIFSTPRGEVTPFTSRLPSALSFIIMIAVCFVFFGKRVRTQEAFITCLILITSFELHRAAMTARVDMVLTALLVVGILGLFRWEERSKLSSYPIHLPVILGCAALVKGPVGIILPLLIFGIYLLILKYNFWKIIYKCLIIVIPSMILPSIWYYLAYKEGGSAFFDVIWAENIGRFLGSDNLDISYNLGHEEPAWYNLITLIAGFIPWTIMLFFSLFGIKYTFKIPALKTIGQNLMNMPRVRLYSLIASVVIIVFYSIPISKRSVYLMPAYPFIALFIAQYALYLTEYKAKATKIFCILVATLGAIVALITIFSVVTHVIDPVQLVKNFTSKEKTLNDVYAMWNEFGKPNILHVFLVLVLALSLYISFYQINKKNNLKILYATIGTYLAMLLIMDGIYLPAFKNGVSVKPIAKEIKQAYPDEYKEIYVLNNLLEYSNMYGLNFYLGNSFRNFEKELPEKGLFLVGKGSFDKFLPQYSDTYEFHLKQEAINKCRDGEKNICLFYFEKK